MKTISFFCQRVALILSFIVVVASCNTAIRGVPVSPVKPSKPMGSQKIPMDTIHWVPGTTPTPAHSEPPVGQKRDNKGSGETYHLAFMLPFLTNQVVPGGVPEKSRLALQFYAGAKIALEQVSTEENMNLVVDVWDTQANDSEFQALLNNTPKLQKTAVFIGPIRASHVAIMAEWAKNRRKIVVSPETPNADITVQNPDFIQTNPSLRAHCSAITRHVRASNQPSMVTLVCKQKESDRLPYFQTENAQLGSTVRFSELVLPDDATSFDGYDLKRYLKAGKKAVFILPSWGSQDFVMAFLRKLREVKGTHTVEVYGMPQWKNFDVIDAEYFTEMNVHISAESYIDYNNPDVKSFQQRFYEQTGTIPDEDGFNGYDVTLFTTKMLARYGLSFPSHLESETFTGLHGTFVFSEIFRKGNLDAHNDTPDYLENTRVKILKFGKSGFEPVNP
jgi:hypothetical protein